MGGGDVRLGRRGRGGLVGGEGVVVEVLVGGRVERLVGWKWPF